MLLSDCSYARADLNLFWSNIPLVPRLINYNDYYCFTAGSSHIRLVKSVEIMIFIHVDVFLIINIVRKPGSAISYF